MMKLKTIVKIAVSALLLLLLIQTVELKTFQSVLTTVSPTMVLLVAVGYLGGQVLGAIKWWLILQSQERQFHDETRNTIPRQAGIPFSRVFRAYFSGMFVNVLGVGTVGGDMTRAILISDENHSKTMCLATVAADRAHGLVVLACIGALSVVLFGGNMLPFWLWATLGAGGVAVVVAWFLGPRFLLAIMPANHFLRDKAEQLARAIPRDRATITTITLLSTIFHLWQILLHQGIALALGITIPWKTLLVSVPFVNVLSNLPISWQGLGVRENGYAFFLVPSVIGYEQAIAMGVIWLFAVTASGIVGGLVSLATKSTGSSSVKN
jgi:glycosyltransferase 2 family protein